MTKSSSLGKWSSLCLVQVWVLLCEHVWKCEIPWQSFLGNQESSFKKHQSWRQKNENLPKAQFGRCWDRSRQSVTYTSHTTEYPVPACASSKLGRNLCSNLSLHPPQQNIRIAWNGVITSNTWVLVQNIAEEQRFNPALPAGAADVWDPRGLHTISWVRSDGCGSFQRSWEEQYLEIHLLWNGARMMSHPNCANTDTMPWVFKIVSGRSVVWELRRAVLLCPVLGPGWRKELVLIISSSEKSSEFSIRLWNAGAENLHKARFNFFFNV